MSASGPVASTSSAARAGSRRQPGCNGRGLGTGVVTGTRTGTRDAVVTGTRDALVTGTRDAVVTGTGVDEADDRARREQGGRVPVDVPHGRSVCPISCQPPGEARG